VGFLRISSQVLTLISYSRETSRSDKKEENPEKNTENKVREKDQENGRRLKIGD
jgi:hypothetical protein